MTNQLEFMSFQIRFKFENQNIQMLFYKTRLIFVNSTKSLKTPLKILMHTKKINNTLTLKINQSYFSILTKNLLLYSNKTISIKYILNRLLFINLLIKFNINTRNDSNRNITISYLKFL